MRSWYHFVHVINPERFGVTVLFLPCMLQQHNPLIISLHRP